MQREGEREGLGKDKGKALLSLSESTTTTPSIGSLLLIKKSGNAQAQATATNANFLKSNAITVAAVSSGISAVLLGYPFDSIKTRMQAFNKYKTAWDCVKVTMKEEGLRGFYRGVIPQLVTTTALRAVSWHVYTAGKESIANSLKLPEGILSAIVPSVCAGAMTGAFASLLAAPLELIKVQRQLQNVKFDGTIPPTVSTSLPAASSPKLSLSSSSSSPSSIGSNNPSSLLGKGGGTGTVFINSAAAAAGKSGTSSRSPVNKTIFGWMAQVIKTKGIGGLYTGYRYHAPMDVIGTSVYFAIYEGCKYYGPKRKLADGSSSETPLAWVSIVGGGAAGAFSWIVVFPIDVIKSMVQKQVLSPSSVVKPAAVLIRERFKEMGIQGFYRGISMQMLRSIPLHSMNFWIYESVLSYCKNQ